MDLHINTVYGCTGAVANLDELKQRITGPVKTGTAEMIWKSVIGQVTDLLEEEHA
jgi:hypothetical protein